ncbi:chromosome segregation ATPase [Cytobacillus eiseniae]|uniref:Chromosome segregation ATPase n=1 Tax=Cytobacillus eiseniae TaxID=762947 RepID=A0ABS4RHJ0_9BACI|nr:hypothetical protein [Cytobacillus eiseniae]MBP2242364.1 chromosome segregation ATPase [Cytobacillus eiseniae]
MKISFNNESIHRQWAASAPTKMIATDAVQNNTNNKDNISISVQAHQLFNGGKNNKANSMIDSLMKQRESIMEMKNNLTERTIDSGKELSTIEEQLKEFNKQIADIDAQIAKQQLEERNKALGQGKEEKASSEPKSDEEKLITQATTFDQAKTLDQVSNQLERKKNTLESEIKQDKSRGIFSERKQELLNELEDKIETVQGQVQEKLGEQVDEVDKEEDHKETLDDKSTEYNQ